MSSKTLLFLRGAQGHGWAMHVGLWPDRAGCVKNLGNVGLGSGRPEDALLSGTSYRWERGQLAVRRLAVEAYVT